MKKIGVTGYQGNLGSRLVNRGCIPITCDVTNLEQVEYEMKRVKPDVVIHCAALTNVAYCEDHARESFDVNVRGTSNVSLYTPKTSLFVYISSDHVFSGEQFFTSGYGEQHKPSPVNRYGFSKWGGELMAAFDHKNVIVRTSKCFDYDYVKPTIAELNAGETVIFTNLIKRSFVHVEHFIDGLLHLVYHYDEYKDADIVHIAGDSVFSYYMFWSFLKEELGLPGKINPRNEKLKNEYPRPFRGGLDVRLAKSLKIPIFGIKDGIELLKKGI